VDKFVRSEDIGYLNDIFKTDHFGNGQGLDPDQKNSPPYAHHGRWGSYFKILFFEFHQVLGKYPDLSDIHLEGCGPLFPFGIEFKLIEVQIGLFGHAQNAAVFEFDAEHRSGARLDLIAEMDSHPSADLDRR
jgi:hypothetical protein